jgi:anti-sigma regulatory factor (Ser/Thr protein kinase)
MNCVEYYYALRCVGARAAFHTSIKLRMRVQAAQRPVNPEGHRTTLFQGAAVEWEFQSADAKAALYARPSFMRFLRSSCKRNSDCQSAEVIFAELVANVVRHAPGPIHITVQCSKRGDVYLDVHDSGKGFTLAPSLPPPSSESGRGLYMVAALSPYVHATRSANGNTVSVVLPVTPA